MKEKRTKKIKNPIRGVIITGASSGIGYAFADYYAHFPYVKDGILVMISSNDTKLVKAKKDLLEKYPQTKILTLAIDLSSPKAPDAILKFCDRHNVRIEVLVNNAGIGYVGAFHKTSSENLSKLLLLNTYAVTRLAHLFLMRMKRRGDQGILLNIASTAAFQPMPYFTTYAATKTYVLNLSVALAEEYRYKRVQILAVCPGPTQTNFLERALHEAKPSKLREVPRKKILRQSEEVVQTTMKAVRSGKTGIHIDGYTNKWLVKLTSFLPYKFKARIAAKFFKEFSEMENAL